MIPGRVSERIRSIVRGSQICLLYILYERRDTPMGSTFVRKMTAVFIALAVLATSGACVFAVSSPTQGAVPDKDSPPGQVQNVDSHGHYREKTLDVSYNAVTDADSYNIYLNDRLVASVIKDTSHTLRCLRTGGKYDITVEAVRDGRAGERSVAVNKTKSRRWFRNTHVKKVKKGKKCATITWKKVKGASGYQIAYSQDGKNWKYKNVKGGKKTKATIKKLSGGKWRFRVRPVKGGYLGLLSAAKSAKIN